MIDKKGCRSQAAARITLSTFVHYQRVGRLLLSFTFFVPLFKSGSDLQLLHSCFLAKINVGSFFALIKTATPKALFRCVCLL